MRIGLSGDGVRRDGGADNVRVEGEICGAEAGEFRAARVCSKLVARSAKARRLVMGKIGSAAVRWHRRAALRDRFQRLGGGGWLVI